MQPHLHDVSASVPFGIFREETDVSFAPTALDEHLVEGAPGSAHGAVRMFGHADVRRTWSELQHGARTGKAVDAKLSGTADPASRTGRDPSLPDAFAARMCAAVATFAGTVLDPVDFAGVPHAVDVGGGEGWLHGTILPSHPHLSGTLLDHAAVAARAGAIFRDVGVANRCQPLAGDVFASVPAGSDLHILCRVVHRSGDADARSPVNLRSAAPRNVAGQGWPGPPQARAAASAACQAAKQQFTRPWRP